MDVPEPPASVPPPPPTWSKFFNDSSPDAFLIHCTQQPAMLLSLPRCFLQAASSVFEDMLTVPQPVPSSAASAYDGQNAPGVLLEVKLPDVAGHDLELALRLAHRDHVANAKRELHESRRSFRSEGDTIRQIVRLLDMAKFYSLDGIPHILFDVLRPPPAPIPEDHLLPILAVAIHFQEMSLVKEVLARWAEEEETSLKRLQEDEADSLRLDECPPSWKDLPFDTWAIKHHITTKIILIDKSESSQYGSWATRSEEQKEVQVMWRWRPTHLSDLDDEFMDLIPVDALRLLGRIETKVLHSSNYSWYEGCYEFLNSWMELSSYRQNA